ncbi:hypothetical protein QEH59_15945 [Coraliomargarita sp. SDUM461004]|uniref:GT-D fold-like domain-containing protein n=1 Tax=Thalassobacterium sedimentorum TaxID=3041258 RepID=A0ABU1AM91_9BACT|nr:hypothetical protein [Coraliomargarita sp. SDUM461004]MDQ8195927.1 hypothetical protein [Coraliomargarita sp. SDUM461004]
MDDDNPYFLRIKTFLRKRALRFSHRGKTIHPTPTGNSLISELLSDGTPCLISRIGGSEAVALAEYRKLGLLTEETATRLLNLSGVFPNEPEEGARFCETYLEAISASDVIGIWGVKDEAGLIRRHAARAQITELRALEPYYHEVPWSRSLENKRVLVVHPFSNLIAKQYDKHESLFSNPQVLPQFKELQVLASVQSIGGTDAFESWSDALEFQKQQIAKHDFDIALIGAGAYGLPLGAHVKSLGKVAIQMGGSLQILFGIKGKRWDTHPIISKLYNEHWGRPGEAERPASYKKVEGGCYW